MITEYVKGKPYFCDVEEKIKSFPYLTENIKCDNLIIGGGIDGSITSYYFAKNNLDTVLIDKNRMGYENTSCATALLEYQLDEHANALTKFFTKQEIVEAYRVGLSALADIDKIMEELGNKCHYSKRDTLIYTCVKSEARELKREYEFRKNNDFDVKYLDEYTNPFPFNLIAGILAVDGGAEFNPYLFTKQLIEKSNEKIRMFENTEATEIIRVGDKFKVITNYGIEIECKNIVCATGYNTKLFTEEKMCDKFISYTIVTSPFEKPLWGNRELLQDNSDPYHYLRLSPDNRLIIGGEDIPFKNDTIKAKVAIKKYEQLYNYACQLFPDEMKEASIDYKFCGAFSATDNNLSVVGEVESRKGIYYNLGYGANGIIYSIYGAQMIVNSILNKPNHFEKHFSPNREII